MAERKAARVLPDPVGAAIRTLRPSRMRGQPSRWGAVGSPRRSVNQRCTAGGEAAREDMDARLEGTNPEVTTLPGGLGANLSLASRRERRLLRRVVELSRGGRGRMR